jgi:hypothetical protein
MAFGGLGTVGVGGMVGIVAGVLTDGIVSPRGRYAQGPNNNPDAAVGQGVTPNLVWQKGDFRTPVTSLIDQNDRVLRADRAALQHLLLRATGASLLGANQGGGFALGAIDSGRVTTGVAAANELGLPVNFGRGRGLWREADIGAIGVSEHSADVAAAGTTHGLFQLIAVNFIEIGTTGFGDLQFDFFASGLRAAPVGSSIELDFRHSLTR